MSEDDLKKAFDVGNGGFTEEYLEPHKEKIRPLWERAKQEFVAALYVKKHGSEEIKLPQYKLSDELQVVMSKGLLPKVEEVFFQIKYYDNPPSWFPADATGKGEGWYFYEASSLQISYFPDGEKFGFKHVYKILVGNKDGEEGSKNLTCLEAATVLGAFRKKYPPAQPQQG
jgi:hypothetical protein